jgi:hypothetical protein
MFNDSNDWYTVRQNGASIPMSQMGINPNNQNISISFILKINNVTSSWRNIFHFTNNDTDGSRLPAIFVYPDNSAKLHMRFDADGNTNNGVDTPNSLPLNTPILITLIFTRNNFKFYIGSTRMLEQSFNNINPRNNNTKLYIGDPWYGSDGGILIKNFTVYDGALSESDISNIMEKLNSSTTVVAGPPGPPGPPGPSGAAGAKGDKGDTGGKGDKGERGDKGEDGKNGEKGERGDKGEDGKNGEKGEKGDKGDKGDKGEDGKQGDVGQAGPKGLSGYDSKTLPYKEI